MSVKSCISEVVSLISSALYDSQLETLEKLKVFMNTKDDVDTDFINELITEFKGILEKKDIDMKDLQATKIIKKKIKKPLNAYNKYIKYVMTLPEVRELVSTEDSAKGKALLKRAMEKWGEIPKDIKSKMKELNRENANLSGCELYTLASSSTSCM